MIKYNKHIAQFLCLILVLLGAEKINFFAPQDCDSRQSFCPTANMYVYHLGTSAANDLGNTSKSKNCKATNILCETFFIAQDIPQTKERKVPKVITKLYFYKPVIHSNPYILVVDPPPIV